MRQKRRNWGTRSDWQRRGQGLVEYLVLVSLVAVSAIGVLSLVGKNIKEQYANVSAALRNREGVPLTAPDARAYYRHGMDDFMDGARVPTGQR